MAIYTQYGRFIKAKLFKEMLESSGDTYMVFGIGNSFWDDPNSGQPIPVAPYNTTCISESGGQFLDPNTNQYFIDPNAEGDDPRIIQTVSDGESVDGTLINRCKNLLPPFPCIWKNYEANNNLIYINYHNIDPAIDIDYITQEDYEKYYVKYDSVSGEDHLYYYDESSSSFINIGAVDLNDSNQPDWADQYYAELRLRGYAIENFGSGYKTPVGLLGAVKCSISYVKDIGSGDNYTGNANQFWYGDRYWEIVDPQESDLDNYINSVDSSAETKIGQDVYPHYLLITATVNPRQLCNDLNIDQKIIPRQIAIYTRKHDGNPDSKLDGKISFSVADHKFNFGQMSKSEAELDNNTEHPTLNFTLPCTVNDVQYPDGDFKFILSDYVRGTNRNLHTVSRFGYIVGF